MLGVFRVVEGLQLFGVKGRLGFGLVQGCLAWDCKEAGNCDVRR